MNYNCVFLDNGWDIEFPMILDGGGVKQRILFAEKIKTMGKKYKRAFEWCSGMGIIGYDLLSRNLCDHIVFNDKFPLAIENCLKTAKNNNISDMVTCYLGDSISSIPKSEKWDLVVANPPHVESRKEWEKHVRLSFAENNQEPWDDELFENWFRLVIDESWNTHVNFFSNLKNHLLPDADVFICENNRYKFLEDLFQQDFNIVKSEPFHVLGKFGLLYHLKAKE